MASAVALWAAEYSRRWLETHCVGTPPRSPWRDWGGLTGMPDNQP
jgi:hypothetical protein